MELVETPHSTGAPTSTRKRSLVKALVYRVVIVCLDFLVVYILTRKTEVALGFMIISNLYTTAFYFLHERLWARIKWGMTTAVSATGSDGDRRVA